MKEGEAESVVRIETMRLVSVISILAIHIAASAAVIGTDGDGVRVLTEANLDDFLSANDVTLVEFYSPSCARCKELRPEFARAARELAKFSLNLGKVNAVTETALRQDFNVKASKQCFFRVIRGPFISSSYDFQSYPTLMLFIKGARVENYEGAADWADIVDYVRKNADPEYVSPPSSVITLANGNFTDFVKDKRAMMVGGQ